jgi:uracil DNA glycosylase
MRALVGLLIAAVITFAAYRLYLSRAAPVGTSVATQAITLTGVKNDLLAIAQAERAYLAQNGRYASFDELVSSGALTMSRPGRDPYAYSIEASGSSFAVTARYTGPPGLNYPTLTIDQTMQIRQQD